MNNKFVRWIMALLGFSAVANSCAFDAPAMYGCPSADYNFDIEVLNAEDDSPITGIRVSAITSKENMYWDNTTGMATYETVTDTLCRGYTTSNGKVQLIFNEFPLNEHTIVADDVDGSANGGKFTSERTTITLNNDDYDNPGNHGWYRGEASASATLKLTPTKDE